MNKKNTEIYIKLEQAYPDARCELDHKTPFQLLIATVLSAQTTDKKVNETTKFLFKDYPDLNSFLTLSQQEIEDAIKKLGLYRNKAKNIYALCRKLIEEFNGEVPCTLSELMSLPGVGKKTANVVLSNAFGMPAFAVDTHVHRVSNRIGIVESSTVEKTEMQLMKAVDKELWIQMHHLLIFHGRRCCSARNPKCEACVIQEYCRYYRNITDK